MNPYAVVHAIEPSVMQRTYCGRALASVSIYGPSHVVANRPDACMKCIEALKRHLDVKQQQRSL